MGEDLQILDNATKEAREQLDLAKQTAQSAETSAAHALTGLLALAVGVAEQMIEQEREG